jgi:hypothetical protein
MKLDGTNGGRGAGRICWRVMADPDSTFNGPFICRSNRLACCRCEFFRRVHSEEEKPIPEKINAVTGRQIAAY